MIRIPKVTMTMRELDRLKCIQGLIDGQLKQTAVATRLALTTRQVRRLVRRYEQQGPIGLISRLRDRPSNRRLKSEAAEHAFGILRSQYADFGPTLAAERLRERHSVDLAVETVRTLMIAGGLWVPRRLRAPKIQQPRSRRACLGELVQIDGCDHRWFEDRAPACQLVQSKRDSRAVDVPSTAHRADGTLIPRTKIVGSKTQRELGEDDLEQAIGTYVNAVSAKSAAQPKTVRTTLNSAGIESTFSHRIDVERDFPISAKAKRRAASKTPGVSGRLRPSDRASDENESTQKRRERAALA
jgi:hypothetical protein